MRSNWTLLSLKGDNSACRGSTEVQVSAQQLYCVDINMKALRCRGTLVLESIALVGCRQRAFGIFSRFAGVGLRMRELEGQTHLRHFGGVDNRTC